MLSPSVYAVITSRDGNVHESVRDAADCAVAHANKNGFESARRTFTGGYGVALVRNATVSHFLCTKYSHLLFIDDDVVLPRDTITKLAGHTRDTEPRSVVMGCYASQKQFGDGTHKVFVVVTKLAGGHEDVYLTWPDGLVEVEAGGAGCMMISRAVLEKMPYPWFRFQGTHIPGHPALITYGEDIDFCARARSMGFRVWADGSIRCGHRKIVDLSQFVGTS